MGSFSVSVVFKMLRMGVQWTFVRVYGFNDDSNKRLLWENAWWNLRRCIGGDFNVTRFPSKLLGLGGFGSAMIEFSYFISENNLVDLPLFGGHFHLVEF